MSIHDADHGGKRLSCDGEDLLQTRPNPKCSSSKPVAVHDTTDNGDDEVRLRLRIRDGRPCILHGENDRVQDPIFPLELIFWARKPKYARGHLRPDGDQCYYCYRTFVAKYKIRFLTAAALKEAFGTNPDVLKEFMGWRTYIIEKYKEAGTRNIRLTYSDDDKAQILKRTQRVQCMVDEEPDVIVLLADYKFGDPATNGKGHKKIFHEGHDCVLMPGAKQWKVKRRKIEEAALSWVEDDGKDQLEENAMVEKLDELSTRIMGTRAVGERMSFDQAFDTPVRSGQRPTQTPSPVASCQRAQPQGTLCGKYSGLLKLISPKVVQTVPAPPPSIDLKICVTKFRSESRPNGARKPPW